MYLNKYIKCLQPTMVILSLFLVSAVHAEKWNYRQNSKINWFEYNAFAFTEAQQKNKPLYIFVYSDLCSWCRKLETETLEKPAIRALLSKRFVPVLVDQQARPALVSQLGISLVPASILITHDGKKLLRFYGFIKEQALLDALNKTLLAWKKGEILEEEFGDQATCCPVPPHAGQSEQSPKGVKP